MSILNYQSGLRTTPPKISTPLIFVHAHTYQKWYEQAETRTKNWINAQKFTAQAGQSICIPDEEGQIKAALAIVKSSPLWEAASIAQGLPAGEWWADFSYAKTLNPHDVQLGWGLAQYKFVQYKNAPKHDNKQDTVKKAWLYLGDTPISQQASALGLGTHIVRDMVNLPPNIMTAQGIEDAALEIATRFGATCHVTKGDALKKEAPALYVVGRAAEIPPRMIDIRWGKAGPLITLIGKGISFDSGGLNLKPAKSMALMKKDMGGAAHALGLAAALMSVKTKIRLRVLIMAAENAISDKAMRPSDVIDTAAGIKVEIGDTDAEGRLVLADAIYHALHDTHEKGKEGVPDAIIDFATLTGAARVALGTECPALFSNHADTARQMMMYGAEGDDPVWHLPLFDGYDRFLDTGPALSNIGGSGYGGAITAALFLRRFAGREVNWVHFDVMAWNLHNRPGRPKGGEAMGLRASFAYIQNLAHQA